MGGGFARKRMTRRGWIFADDVSTSDNLLSLGLTPKGSITRMMRRRSDNLLSLRLTPKGSMRRIFANFLFGGLWMCGWICDGGREGMDAGSPFTGRSTEGLRETGIGGV